MSVEQTRFRRSTYFLSILQFSHAIFKPTKITLVGHLQKLPSKRGHFSLPTVCLRRLLIRLTKPRLNMFHRYTLYMRLLLLQVREGTYIPT